MKLNDIEVTAKELGELLGRSARHIRQLTADGILTRVARGKYPLAENLKSYLLMLETPSEPGEMRRERLRVVQAQAEKLERENAVARGELIEIELVGQEVEDSFARCRARLMAVPGNVAATVVGETDPNVVQSRVMDEVSAALNELSYGAEEAAKTE